MRTDAIAPLVSYICYDTTDLTELSFGCSKHDSTKFTVHYLKSISHSFDPFQQFDEAGVGKLLEMAVSNAKKVNKSLTQCVISDNHGCDFRFE
jgi:pyruvate, orthophosphate dikinase